MEVITKYLFNFTIFMDKEMTIKHLRWIWVFCLIALGLILYVANQDYADRHDWIVEHSEIKP